MTRLLTLASRRFKWERVLADRLNFIEDLNARGDFEAGLDATACALRIESLVNRLDQKVWAELRRMTGDIGRD